ncbi:MAG: hypothetical protein IKY52_04025 [Clostridia bacterium]|nr:hypothetical protein [Clostridia bacterium]
MNQEGKNKKKRLGALDICILTAVLLCIAGTAVRLVFKEDSVLAQNAQQDTYTVYFTVKDIRETSSRYLYSGAEFYIDESGEYFGKLTGTPGTTPALRIYADANGNQVEVYNNTDDDRMARIDVEGAFTVSAVMDKDGYLMLNGNTYIAPNKEVKVRSKELMVNIRITSIVKAN